MLFGVTPWPSKDIVELIHNLSALPLKFGNQSISEAAKNFISRCLKLEEKERMDWDDIFNHEIFGKDNQLLRENNEKKSTSQLSFR